MDIEKCKKCDSCRIKLKGRFGVILGCYENYKGKCISEIKECPKEKKECQKEK